MWEGTTHLILSLWCWHEWVRTLANFQRDWGENFNKAILHLDKSDLGFLDFLSQFSSQGREATRVRREEEEAARVELYSPYSRPYHTCDHTAADSRTCGPYGAFIAGRTTHVDRTAVGTVTHASRTARGHTCELQVMSAAIQGDISSHTGDISKAVQQICKLKGFSKILLKL
jgi:hypothetical protein